MSDVSSPLRSPLSALAVAGARLALSCLGALSAGPASTAGCLSSLAGRALITATCITAHRQAQQSGLFSLAWKNMCINMLYMDMTCWRDTG